MASKVHRVRFYNPIPQSINCASFNKKLKLIAVARSDVSIEIWDLKKAPYLVRFIPGVDLGSVEALGWVGERLLCTGLNGSLVEWDLSKLTRKKSVLLTGYAAWCLDINSDETLVAVGTEQGYINLYSVDNDDIVYNKLFDKQDGRIMCCKFDITGKILVTGSIDTIRVWNVQTGHAVTRISVSRRQKEVIVWCLAVLSDNTIVSGDSMGRLTFWDGIVGEQIESYATHKADMLCLGVSEDEKNIYCSGVDPIISHFKKIDKAQGGQWVRHVQRHIHEHDVRGLIVADGTLISVGIDGYLTFSSYPPKWVMRVPPMVPAPRSFVCGKKKLLLLRYSNHLELWKLGQYATSDSGDLIVSNINTDDTSNQKQHKNQIEQDSTITEATKLANKHEKKGLKLVVNPLKLVTVHTKHKKQIQCCALSPTGEFIVYATSSEVRLLKLDTDDAEDQTNISVSKILITGMSPTCDRVAFSEDSQTMVAHSNGTLYILHVDADAGATVVQTINSEKILNTTSLLHLMMSNKTLQGQSYIGIAGVNGAVAVLTDRKKRFVCHAALPRRPAAPAALAIDERREAIVVVYADQEIVEYDLGKKRVTGWPGARVPAAWRARGGAAQSAGVHPRTGALVCCDHRALWVLHRDGTAEETTEPVVKRKQDAVEPLKLNVIPIKYLAGYHWLSEDEAVMIEVLPENIVSQLPAPIRVNRWT